MENVWVTADLHFDHDAILKHCSRPFKNTEEMNDYMIDLWNAKINKHDHVYIIGDFAFKNHVKFINALKGQKHLIIGSHDSMSSEVYKRFITVDYQKQIKYKDRYFVMSHCPLRTWENCFRGNIQLVGHCHGRMNFYNLTFDIGVDTHDYSPYNMDEVMEMVNKKEIEMQKEHRIVLNEKGEKIFYQDDVKYLEYLVQKSRKE